MMLKSLKLSEEGALENTVATDVCLVRVPWVDG